MFLLHMHACTVAMVLACACAMLIQARACYMYNYCCYVALREPACTCACSLQNNYLRSDHDMDLCMCHSVK